MRRLTIFAKGNADVRDSLYALFEDGETSWNGINVALAERGHSIKARVIHEIGLRSDMLLAPAGQAPERDLPLDIWNVEAQRRTRLFEKGHDAVILSIQPDVMTRIARHRTDGGLFYPHGADRWPAEDRRWLMAHYEPVPPLTPDQSMASLCRLFERVQEEAGPMPVLVFNLSPVIGWERIASYQGLGETLGERIRRFNLALIELSRAIGVQIVDVEAIVAREGVRQTKRDAVTLTSAGCRAVALEVVQILEDLGLVTAAPGES